MRTRAVWILTLLVIASSVSADSLWDPEAPGLLSGSGDLQVGDTVLVRIDSDSTISYDSSRIDSERVSIELSGGEGGDLFSFLPSGSSSGNQTLRGEESLTVRATFAVVVTEIDGNGQLVLQGGRTIAVQGQQESLFLTGTADPILVGEDRTIPFSGIVNARLTYTTLLQPGTGVLSARDLERREPQPAEEGEEETPAAAASSTLTLTEEKREELLLLYLNRLLDLVFE